jgi:hypothetical protein
MSGNQLSAIWQADLIVRYPNLFDQKINRRVAAPFYPSVGDGWSDLVETAIIRITTAVTATSGRIAQDRPHRGKMRGNCGWSRTATEDSLFEEVDPSTLNLEEE